MRLVFALALIALASLPAEAATVCIGTAMISRAYSGTPSRGDVDSGIGDCLFAADSPIGRQIDSVCQVGTEHRPGQSCRIEAVVVRHAIKRIIAIRRQ